MEIGKTSCNQLKNGIAQNRGADVIYSYDVDLGQVTQICPTIT